MNDNPEWNISYYFNLYDQKNDVTAFMRIGSKPNKDEKSVFLFVIDKGRVYGLRNAVPCDEDRRSCSGLTFAEENGVWSVVGAFLKPSKSSRRSCHSSFGKSSLA